MRVAHLPLRLPNSLKPVIIATISNKLWCKEHPQTLSEISLHPQLLPEKNRHILILVFCTLNLCISKSLTIFKKATKTNINYGITHRKVKVKLIG